MTFWPNWRQKTSSINTKHGIIKLHWRQDSMMKDRWQSLGHWWMIYYKLRRMRGEKKFCQRPMRRAEYKKLEISIRFEPKAFSFSFDSSGLSISHSFSLSPPSPPHLFKSIFPFSFSHCQTIHSFFSLIFRLLHFNLPQSQHVLTPSLRSFYIIFLSVCLPLFWFFIVPVALR